MLENLNISFCIRQNMPGIAPSCNFNVLSGALVNQLWQNFNEPIKVLIYVNCELNVRGIVEINSSRVQILNVV